MEKNLKKSLENFVMINVSRLKAKRRNMYGI